MSDGCLEYGEEWEEEPAWHWWHGAVIGVLWTMALIVPLVVIR